MRTFKKTHLALVLCAVSAASTATITHAVQQPALANNILPASKEKIETVSISNQTGDAPTPATTKPTTGVTSSDNHSSATDPKHKVEDAHEESVGCVAGLDEEMATVQEEKLEMVASTAGVAAKMLEDLGKDEATKGCVTAHQEIIDLTVALPKIPTSWGDVAEMTRKAAQKRMQAIKQGLMERGCEIADKAMRDALAPVVEMQKKWNASTERMSNADALVGAAIGDRLNRGADRITQKLEGQLAQAEERFSKVNSNIKGKYDSLEAGLDDTLDGTVFNFVLQDGVVANKSSQQEIARQMLAEAQAKIPSAPTVTARRGSDGYQKCTVNGNVCSSISASEFSSINAQWQQYHEAKRHYQEQVDRMQTLVNGSEIKGGTTVGALADKAGVSSLANQARGAATQLQGAVNSAVSSISSAFGGSTGGNGGNNDTQKVVLPPPPTTTPANTGANNTPTTPTTPATAATAGTNPAGTATTTTAPRSGSYYNRFSGQQVPTNN